MKDKPKMPKKTNEEFKKNIKPVINEGDCLRCPYCGTLTYGKYGVCGECGERYGT